MQHVQPLTKHRVQVSIHMDLHPMLTQLPVYGACTGSVYLAPKRHVRVQNSAKWVVTIRQKGRAAAICPKTQWGSSYIACVDQHDRHEPSSLQYNL